jgi:hypothetical protein
MMAEGPGTGASRTWLLIVALLVVAVIAWLLISRSGESEEPTYEAGVTDISGGELIVTDPEETGVPVNLPETPMTNVPAEQPTGEPEAPPAE